VHYRFRSAADTQASDAQFAAMRRLYDAGVINRVFSRNVGMTNIPGDFGTTSFCAINSDRFNKPFNCRHWIRRIDGATLAEHLAVHQSDQMIRLAKIGALIAFFAAVFTLVALFR